MKTNREFLEEEEDRKLIGEEREREEAIKREGKEDKRDT